MRSENATCSGDPIDASRTSRSRKQEERCTGTGGWSSSETFRWPTTTKQPSASLAGSLPDFLRPKFEEDRHNFADIEIQQKLSQAKLNIDNSAY